MTKSFKKISGISVLKRIFLVALILASLYTVPQIVLSFIKVQMLPTVDKPLSFARHFNPAQYKETTLQEVKTKDMLYGNVSLYYLSPFFPNWIINFDTIPAVSCVNEEKQERQLFIDTRWHVFWIRTWDCNGEGRHLYGPFRLKQSVKSVYDIEEYVQENLFR